DKVDEFYQHILSLELMQDLPRGRYKSPEELLQKPVDNTPNFLQGFVAYIKKHGEPWQSDIAATFERMRRPMAAIPSTKIMNEGWATLSQYLLLEYAPARWQT